MGLGTPVAGQEIKALTSLRGIAASLIVVMHLRKEFGAAIDLDTATHFFEKCYLWVDFFFVLSGFIIAHVYARTFVASLSRANWTRFLSKRIGRVYPLHVVTLVCFVVTEAAKYLVPTTANAPFTVNTWGAFVANLLLVQAWGFFDHPTWNQPSWSISTEWFAYLLFPVFVVLFERIRSVPVCVGAAVLCAFGLSMVVTAGHLGTLNLLTGLALFRCLFAFLLGMLVFRFQQIATPRILGALGSDVSLVASLVVAVSLMHFGAYDVATVAAFVWVVASARLNSGFGAHALSHSFLYFLGVISYSIYLVQGLVVRAWQMAFQVVWHSHIGTGAAALVFVLLLATVVAASTFSYRWIEVPGRRYFYQLSEHWPLRKRALAVDTVSGADD